MMIALKIILSLVMLLKRKIWKKKFRLIRISICHYVYELLLVQRRNLFVIFCCCFSAGCFVYESWLAHCGSLFEVDLPLY